MKRFALALVRLYQTQISPKSGPRCKYVPTCSHYAVTAIERYGVMRGGLMALWRVLRCNPFSKGGYDPVKEDPYVIIRRE